MPDGDNRNLPDLDYAFLAEYAKVEAQGTLTVVGASFTEARFPDLPSAMAVHLAGRLRVREDGPPVGLNVRFSGPSTKTPRLDLSAELAANGPAYDGRVGVLFAVGFNLPIVEHGVHEVLVLLEGTVVRTLKFHVAP